MISLFPKPDFSMKRLGRPAVHAKRNPDVLPAQLSPQQVKVEARRLLAGGLPPRIWRVVDLLFAGGVLSARQLDIPASTLRRWAHAGLITRLPFSSEEIKAGMRELGLQDEQPLLYCLGPLGMEVASIRYEVLPASGYMGYPLMRILHDVVVSEIVLELGREFGKRGWKVDWYGKYESTLTDSSGHVILEPDAFIYIQKEDWDLSFAVEYHNEDKMTRAAEKVTRYEHACAKGNWRERWEVETFPPVLAVFRHAIVGEGYKRAVQNQRREVKYYGKVLAHFQEGRYLEWVDVRSLTKQKILPE